MTNLLTLGKKSDSAGGNEEDIPSSAVDLQVKEKVGVVAIVTGHESLLQNLVNHQYSVKFLKNDKGTCLLSFTGLETHISYFCFTVPEEGATTRACS